MGVLVAAVIDVKVDKKGLWVNCHKYFYAKAIIIVDSSLGI